MCLSLSTLACDLRTITDALVQTLELTKRFDGPLALEAELLRSVSNQDFPGFQDRLFNTEGRCKLNRFSVSANFSFLRRMVDISLYGVQSKQKFCWRMSRNTIQAATRWKSTFCYQTHKVQKCYLIMANCRRWNLTIYRCRRQLVEIHVGFYGISDSKLVWKYTSSIILW